MHGETGFEREFAHLIGRAAGRAHSLLLGWNSCSRIPHYRISKGENVKGRLRGLLVAAACAAAAVQVHAGTSHRTKIETIRFERGACFGNCPVYVLTVRSDGRGTFDGRRYTNVHGIRDFRLTRAQFADFRARLAPYRPRHERILEGNARCNGHVATDQISVDVRWTGKGPPAHLDAYFGCDMERNALMFRALVAATEALPQVQTFVRTR